MTGEPFAGIYPILQTPFNNDGSLDELSLRREVDFCIRGGVHGVVIPAGVSEFFTLSTEERAAVIRMTVEEAAGRVPVLAGTSAPVKELAASYSRTAEELGADGVLTMFSYVRNPGEEQIYSFFDAVASAVSIPLMMQSSISSPIPTKLAARLLSEIPGIRYVKEEGDPPGLRISALLKSRARHLSGVFGGMAGTYLITELERGACGNMPAAAFADVQVRIYEAFRSGDKESARSMQRQLLPLIVIFNQYITPVAKLILQRRGVFKTATSRDPAYHMPDEVDQREIERLLEELSPLYVVK